MPMLFAKSKEYVRNLQLVFSIKTKKLRCIYLLNLTIYLISIAQSMQLSRSHGNKNKYEQYKQCRCCLLQCTHDAVSGWLMLASLFYKEK